MAQTGVLLTISVLREQMENGRHLKAKHHTQLTNLHYKPCTFFFSLMCINFKAVCDHQDIALQAAVLASLDFTCR